MAFSCDGYYAISFQFSNQNMPNMKFEELIEDHTCQIEACRNWARGPPAQQAEMWNKRAFKPVNRALSLVKSARSEEIIALAIRKWGSSNVASWPYSRLAWILVWLGRRDWKRKNCRGFSFFDLS